MSALIWIGERLKDLFYGPGNLHLDEGRVAIWVALMLMALAAFWNAHLRQPIDLAALGGALTGILTAGAAILAAKQWASTQFQVGAALKAKTETVRSEGSQK